MHWLSGIRADRWAALLWRERFAVDATLLGRAAEITALSVVSTALSIASAVRDGPVPEVGAEHPPLFVVGHWRQGTTHLHNLLALDPAHTFVSTYAALNPGHHRWTEAWLAPRLRLPATRPMDAMPLGFALPQEDEYALALESLVSPHFALVFPRTGAWYLAHLALRDVSAAEIARWERAMRRVVHGHAARDPRRLVLKSPTHTARVRRLAALFPGARFVHVHRDPYVVFQSMRHLIATTAPHQQLQAAPPGAVDDRILDTYDAMYDAWFEEAPALPPGQRAELAFADLERDPVGALGRVYEALGLPGFDAVAPRIAAEHARLAGYRKNVHVGLTEAERARVAARWRRSFEAWGYPT